jgi:hypothetical protein
MSELQVIETMLRQTARRRRWQRAFQGLGWGVFAGAGLMLLAVLTYKLLPVPKTTLGVAGGVALAASLAGMIRGAWRKPTVLETARWVDEQKGLKERLSTALELNTVRTPEDWKQLLLADAAQHAHSLNARELLPFGVPRAARWALLLAALCAGLGFVPEYRSKAHVQQQQDAAVIKDVGRNLSDLMRRELAQKPPVLPPTEQSMQQVAEFGDKLGQPSLTRSEALRELTSLTEQLARQEQELARNPALKPLERAAREPGNGAATSPESLRKQIESLQKALGDAAANADKLDKLSKDLESSWQRVSRTSPASRARPALRSKVWRKPSRRSNRTAPICFSKTWRPPRTTWRNCATWPKRCSNCKSRRPSWAKTSPSNLKKARVRPQCKRCRK